MASNVATLRNETTAIANQAPAEVLEQVVINGDLSKLTPQQRVMYYGQVCESLGLNPYTKPFDYINLNGKLTLYAKRDCTDQLRSVKGISVRITQRERLDDLYIVQAQGTDAKGRTDESIGAVNVAGLKGENLANALMKAETKAKRRVTLSLAGLGWIDESEADSIPGAQRVSIEQAHSDEPLPVKNVTPPKEQQPQASAPQSQGATKLPSAAEMIAYGKSKGLEVADIQAAFWSVTGRDSTKGWTPNANECRKWAEEMDRRAAEVAGPGGDDAKQVPFESDAVPEDIEPAGAAAN